MYLKEADKASKRVFDDVTPFTMPFLEDILSNNVASKLEQVMKDKLCLFSHTDCV